MGGFLMYHHGQFTGIVMACATLIACGVPEPGKQCSRMISCCNALIHAAKSKGLKLDEVQRCADFADPESYLNWTNDPDDEGGVCTFRLIDAAREARAAELAEPAACDAERWLSN